MFEPHLPMRGIKVRAYDIDTYNDYLRVSELQKTGKYDRDNWREWSCSDK